MDMFDIKESGLQINITSEGLGDIPEDGDVVLMHYEIWSGSGVTSSEYDHSKEEYVDDIYDSTYDEKSPYSGPIEIIVGTETPKVEIYTKGQSIKGIDEALKSLRVGGKAELLIPPSLAYGEEGASSFHTFHGYRTPPTMPTRCNVELVEIKSSLKEEKAVTDSGPAYEAL